MALEIIWTKSAVEDLKSIVRFISEDNPDAAIRLGNRIISRIEEVSDSPRSGRMVPEKGDLNIREVILTPYRIIYSIADQKNSMHVIRIWHAARGTPP